MSDTSYPSALPSTGTPSQCIIGESLTIGMLSCAHAASTAKVGVLIASQAAGDLASKSHSTISFLLVLAATVSGWILHGANSELKTGLQKVSKGAQL